MTVQTKSTSQMELFKFIFSYFVRAAKSYLQWHSSPKMVFTGMFSAEKLEFLVLGNATKFCQLVGCLTVLAKSRISIGAAFWPFWSVWCIFAVSYRIVGLASEIGIFGWFRLTFAGGMWRSWLKFAFVECEFQHINSFECEYEWECHLKPKSK